MNNADLLEHVTSAFVLEGERIRDQLMVGMTAFDRGNRITAARPRPLAQYANQLTWGGPCRVVGWSLRAVGGAAQVNLRDSHDATGDIIATVDLTPGSAAPAWFGPGGITVGEALFTEVLGGNGVSVVGAVYLGVVD